MNWNVADISALQKEFPIRQLDQVNRLSFRLPENYSNSPKTHCLWYHRKTAGTHSTSISNEWLLSRDNKTLSLGVERPTDPKHKSVSSLCDWQMRWNVPAGRSRCGGSARRYLVLKGGTCRDSVGTSKCCRLRRQTRCSWWMHRSKCTAKWIQLVSLSQTKINPWPLSGRMRRLWLTLIRWVLLNGFRISPLKSRKWFKS